MEEVLDIQFGMKINAIERTQLVVKNGELSGTLNAKNISTMLPVAYVPLIAS